jgi:predicted MFS family arabinose efflux permease
MATAMSPASDAIIDAGGRWAAAALTLATFLSGLSSFALGPFLPVIAADLGAGVAMLGQVPASASLAAATLGLVAGPLADRIGERRALLVALVALAAGALGTGLAPGLGLLLLAMLAGAVGRAAATPAAQAIAAARFAGEARRRAMSGMTAGTSAALVLGVPLLTAAAAVVGWRGAFAGLALLTLAGALLARRVLSPDGPRGGERLRVSALVAAYAPIAGHPATRGLIGAQVLGLAGTATLVTYVGAFLAERHGASTQAVGGAYLALGLGALAGAAAVGGRLGRLPLRSLVGGARAAIGLLGAAALLLPLPAPAAVGLLAVGVALMAVANAAVPTLLAEETPAGRATTMALNGAAMSLGGALGASVGGLLLATAGYGGLGLGALGWYVASVVLMSRSEVTRRPAAQGQ